ncbi:PREDICTED: zyxin [Bison bison bison]|uniref:Zyxin n=1 Tax=Bison bison bison TaxID=43346 RepID=A0A6P3H151_BISBB|nr:PREDICTED: zyxin [Bison bison bison]
MGAWLDAVGASCSLLYAPEQIAKSLQADRVSQRAWGLGWGVDEGRKNASPRPPRRPVPSQSCQSGLSRRGFGAQGWRLGGKAEEQLEVAGNGRPGEEGAGPGRRHLRAAWAPLGQPPDLRRLSPEVGGPLLTALRLLPIPDFPLPPPPVVGEADDAEGALGGAFPPPPPPIDEPFPPAPLEEEIFPSPPPPLVEEGGPEAPTQFPSQPREKVSSIDLEIDSLSSLLDDMTKNDPFKARVSSGYVPPPVTTPFISKSNTKPSTGGTAPLPPWKSPSSSQPVSQAQPQSQTQFHVQSQPQAKPQAPPQPVPLATTQPRGPLAPSPAPKFSPVTPKFTPVASKFSPGAPGGPGSQPHQKLGPPEAPSSTGTGSPQPPSFTYAQQKEKPQVQEKQHPVPPPTQNQNQVRDAGRMG